jgi:hypothetical protein
MTAALVSERFHHRAVFAIGVTDSFARARGIGGVATPPFGQLKLYVIERASPAPAVFARRFECATTIARSGCLLVSGDVASEGQRGTRTLPPGRYGFRLESEYYQTVEFVRDWPPPAVRVPADDIDLLPGPGYPFPSLDVPQGRLGVTLFRGTVVSAAGAGIENATVKLTAPALPDPHFFGFTNCSTDARGEWVLAVIDKRDPKGSVPQADYANARVHVTEPSASYDVDVPANAGKENSLPQTALRGLVLRPNRSPFPDVQITTSVRAGESVTRSDGQWFFYFELRQASVAVTITATAPDGRTVSTNAAITAMRTNAVPAIQFT